MFVDYKEEALKTFVDLFEGKTLIPGESAPVAEDEEKNRGSDGGMTFQRIVNSIGENSVDNLLGMFSLEYAESRGNLNKEQAFFYLALY